MATGYYDEPVEGIWDALYPKQYDPEKVRVIIREEIDLALRSPDISQLLIDGTLPVSKLRFAAGETLPLASADGGLFIYQGSGFSWLLQFHRTSGYWHFVGGASLFAEVLTSEAETSLTYDAMATAGPSISLPFPGDYDVTVSCDAWNNTSSLASFMSYDIGTTTASDDDAATHQEPAGDNLSPTSVHRTRRKTGLGAVTLTAKYRVTGGTGAFRNRAIFAIPVRVRRA